MAILSDEKRPPRGLRNSSAGMVRVVVKLRPEQYDALFRHVCLVGSTLSEFFRESAVNAVAFTREGNGSAPGPLGSAATQAVSTGDQEKSSKSV
jgi:hypothetical protein